MDFKNKLILAPMAGVSDYPLRRLARRYGADLCVSEMISSKAIHYKDKKTAELAMIREDDSPIGLQIFGHEPEIMAEACALLTNFSYEHAKSDTPPDFIDINMGCPVRKIVTAGDGSALMKEPKLCGEIISACVKATHLPVTVKIRAGWDRASVNCTEIAKIAEDKGASAIFIHARTREQMYEPYANWDYIRQVKEAVSIPIIGNGDIFCAADAIKMKEQTGADSLLIGRGAMGNPFIFEEIKCAFNKTSYTPPTISQVIAVALEQVESLVLEKGEAVGMCEARKHIAWYLKGFKSSAKIRGRVNSVCTLEELKGMLYEYAEGLKEEL